MMRTWMRGCARVVRKPRKRRGSTWMFGVEIYLNDSTDRRDGLMLFLA